MAKRVSFSREHPDVPETAEHHADLEASLRTYFSYHNPDFLIRFAAYQPKEVEDELALRLSEIGLTSSLTLLSSIEAILSINYLQRYY